MFNCIVQPFHSSEFAENNKKSISTFQIGETDSISFLLVYVPVAITSHTISTQDTAEKNKPLIKWTKNEVGSPPQSNRIAIIIINKCEQKTNEKNINDSSRWTERRINRKYEKQLYQPNWIRSAR